MDLNQFPMQPQQRPTIPMAPPMPSFAGNTVPMAPIGEIVWVSDVSQLSQLNLPPNSSHIFMNREKPVFYLVSIDKVGMREITAYQFSEVPQAKPEDKYVTRDELASIIKQLGGVNNEPNPQPNAEQTTQG